LLKPPLAMPNEYKESSVIKSYRKFYIGDKKKFAKYTKRRTPLWLLIKLKTSDNQIPFTNPKTEKTKSFRSKNF